MNNEVCSIAKWSLLKKQPTFYVGQFNYEVLEPAPTQGHIYTYINSTCVPRPLLGENWTAVTFVEKHSCAN